MFSDPVWAELERFEPEDDPGLDWILWPDENEEPQDEEIEEVT